uniref:Uncharacterized protein n=1 Tax=Leptospirillum ferrodiazotrophum TaxID=412449 RepID=C6HXG8_9BACT|nr:MAG: conserved hypothetical protein [Leptospirillum ferrodiazotrophum]
MLVAVSVLCVGRLPPSVLATSGPPPVSLQPPSSTAGTQAPASSPASPVPSVPVSSPLPTSSRPAPLSLNGPDALAAYRSSWNPLTSGPDLMPQADTLPEGEFNVRFFMYGRFTQAQYSDSGGITGLPPGFSQTQLLDLFAMFYGLEQNTELVFLPSVVTTFSTEDGTSLNGAGLNDLTLGIKHRWIIQDPNTLRPSFATALLVTLPLTSWLGTPVPAGGLPPINVVPSTHFGTPSLTLVSMLRKNVRPLRLIGDLYYTFGFPGSLSATPGATPAYSQFGDLAQYRLGIEDVVDDKSGLGFILEIAGLSGLPFSVDGLAVNTHPTSFNLVGVQPTIEYNITPRLAASFGVLLPAFGNNEYLATTPNFSLWYYFQGGQKSLLPR